MKAYTDIAQSRKLAEILPIESADMKWYYFKTEIDAPKNPTFGFSKDAAESYKDSEAVYIPCWSLAALLDVLPISINEGQHCLALINSDPNGIDWLCCYENYKGESIMECYADNPIDACVEMIMKLHERKLL